MTNQKATFAKRRREQDRKDKARAKQERLAARRSEVRTTKGPPIAWDQAVHPVVDDELPPAPPVPGDAPTGTPTPDQTADES
jgi:hypothetical protein